MARLNRSLYLRLLSAALLVGLGLGVLSTGAISTLVNAAMTNSQTPASNGAYFDHVVIIIMEDHGIQDICAGNPPPCSGANGAPYMAGLANSYASGSHYLGINHFSQANYLALLGGDTFGCSDSGCAPVSNPNLVDRLEAAGLSWKGYMEDQNVASGCDDSYHEPYTLEHNPFMGFTDILNAPARCAKIVLANPSSCSVTDCALVDDLNSMSAPNFMWLTPNNCNNMHGFTGICPSSIPVGDNYLKSLVPNILNSNTFTIQRSVLFVVYDEGNGYCPLNGSSEDCVYAVVAGPEVKTNFVTSNLYNHYSFLKTIEDNWNLASLTSNDANASPMKEFFSTTPALLLSTGFTYNPGSPDVGQNIFFTASASGGMAPYQFSWTFGDGSTGTGDQVYHSYSSSGSYQVVLTARDSSSVAQTATSSQTVTVNSPSPPPSQLTASFTYSLTSPVVGQTITFQGSASGGTAPYTFSWDFGDSATASGSTASHAYNTAGEYSVVMTVGDSAGHVTTVVHTITVSAALSASISYTPTNPGPLTPIQFTASTTGGTQPFAYSWDFGDGTTGTGSPVSHSYLLPGTYTLTLTVTDASGQTATASATVTVSITISLASGTIGSVVGQATTGTVTSVDTSGL